jgi:hypothetical protein
MVVKTNDTSCQEAMTAKSAVNNLTFITEKYMETLSKQTKQYMSSGIDCVTVSGSVGVVAFLEHLKKKTGKKTNITVDDALSLIDNDAHLAKILNYKQEPVVQEDRSVWKEGTQLAFVFQFFAPVTPLVTEEQEKAVMKKAAGSQSKAASKKQLNKRARVQKSAGKPKKVAGKKRVVEKKRAVSKPTQKRTAAKKKLVEKRGSQSAASKKATKRDPVPARNKSKGKNINNDGELIPSSSENADSQDEDPYDDNMDQEEDASDDIESTSAVEGASEETGKAMDSDEEDEDAPCEDDDNDAEEDPQENVQDGTNKEEDEKEEDEKEEEEKEEEEEEEDEEEDDFLDEDDGNGSQSDFD